MKLDTMTFEVADTLNKFPLDYTDENNFVNLNNYKLCPILFRK